MEQILVLGVIWLARFLLGTLIEGEARPRDESKRQNERIAQWKKDKDNNVS